MSEESEKTCPENTGISNVQKAMESEFLKGLEEINDTNVSYDRKLEIVVKLNSQVLPSMFRELFAQKPNADRSMVGSRMCMALKNMTDVIVKKRETEVSEEINPDSPKFQKAFEWFIETVRVSMEEAGMDSTSINNTFNVMANRLQGWEQMINRSLRGVSSKAMSEVENPFIKDFIARTRGEESPVEGVPTPVTPHPVPLVDIKVN